MERNGSSDDVCSDPEPNGDYLRHIAAVSYQRRTLRTLPVRVQFCTLNAPTACPKMGRRRRYEGDDYHKRLKVLKNKLEPFRNKHTTKCISEIMKSSSLPRHLDNILRILSSNPSNLTVQKCLQNVADDVTSRIHAKRSLPKLDMTVDLVKKFNQADLNSLETEGNQMNHTYIKPSAFNVNTMSRSNCSGPANTSYEVHDINIDPSANSTDTVSRGNLSYPGEAINILNHVSIDPLVNKFNTINFDKT